MNIKINKDNVETVGVEILMNRLNDLNRQYADYLNKGMFGLLSDIKVEIDIINKELLKIATLKTHFKQFNTYEQKQSYFEVSNEQDFVPHAVATLFPVVGSLMLPNIVIEFQTIDELLTQIRPYEKSLNKKDFYDGLNRFVNNYSQYNTEFLQLLFSHKNAIISKGNDLIYEVKDNLINHDLDKLFNEETYNIYSEHFSKLKAIDFTDKAYKEYEEKYFPQAHYNHNQEAHQFYDYRHQPDTKVDLTLLLEVVLDITVTAKAYGNADAESIATIIYNKGPVKDLVSFEVILNTVKKILQ